MGTEPPSGRGLCPLVQLYNAKPLPSHSLHPPLPLPLPSPTPPTPTPFTHPSHSLHPLLPLSSPTPPTPPPTPFHPLPLPSPTPPSPTPSSSLKVEGLNGVLFANVKNPRSSYGASVVSYDKGGRWDAITPPTIDSNNRPIRCTPVQFASPV